VFGSVCKGASQAKVVQKVLSGLALPVRKLSAFLASLAGTVREGKCGCSRQGKNSLRQLMDQATNRRLPLAWPNRTD
jgi:hypothetical protein